jgi:hypothetical protein
MLKVLINSVEVTNELESGIDSPVNYSVLDTGTTIEVQSDRPVTKLYWKSISSHDGNLSFSYWNGSTFNAASISRDTSDKLRVQGWIEWAMPTDLATDGGFYKYRFVISGASVTVAATLSFVGIVFSEDKDLKIEYPNIGDYLPEGDSSFLRFHVAARDAIVQWFRGKGISTVVGTEAKNLTEWDFLDIDEVKNASKFKTLAKIMRWLSDASDDKWYQKALDFENMGNNSLDVYFISIDKDRDGEADTNETLLTTDLVIRRA